MEELKPKLYRNWTLILYRDSESYDYLDFIATIRGLKYWAYIEHKPESDEKKYHTHVILRFENAKSLKSILKLFPGINELLVQPIYNLRKSNRYLTHIDYPDKIQYDLSQVYFSHCYELKFLKSFDDFQTEKEIIESIHARITTMPHDDYFDDSLKLIEFVNEMDYSTIYKRYRQEFLEYFKSFY